MKSNTYICRNQNRKKMKIIIKNNSTQTAIEKQNKAMSDQATKNLFKEVIEAKKDMAVEWVNDDEVCINSPSALPIHSFVLEAEKLGKKVNYSKQTIITIID